MTYQQIEGEINDMMAEQQIVIQHYNRVIAGFSVNLYRSENFGIGCGLFATNSGMEAAKWIHEHQDREVKTSFRNLPAITQTVEDNRTARR